MKHRMITLVLLSLLLMGGFGSLNAEVGSDRVRNGVLGCGVEQAKSNKVGNPYKDPIWGEVDSLLQLEYYQEAYSKAVKLYYRFSREHNGHQMVAGADRLSQINMAIHEEAFDSVLERYTSLSSTLQGIDQALCHLRVAQYYMLFYERNRWKINNYKATNDVETPYRLWNKNRILDTIQRRVEEALGQQELLMATRAEALMPIARLMGDDTCRYEAVSCFEVMVEAVNNLYYNLKQLNEWNLRIHNSQLDINTAEDLMGSWERFVAMPFPSVKDVEMKMRFYQIALLVALEQMYLSDPKTTEEQLMKRFLQRQDAVLNVVNLSFETCLKGYEEGLKLFGKLEVAEAGRLYYNMAQTLDIIGDKVGAMRYIDTALSRFAKSEWTTECENLKKSILKNEIWMTMEDNIVAGKDWMALAEYRNVDKLYFRIVKDELTPKEEWNRSAKDLLKQKEVGRWSMPVERGNDYKKRQVYVPVSCQWDGKALPVGKYIMLVSDDSTFAQGFIHQYFQVSSIFIMPMRDRLCGFVTSRESGAPIENVQVTLQWKSKYSKSDNFSNVLTVKTDKNGYYDLERTIDQNKSLHKKGWYRVVINYGGEQYEETSQWRFFDNASGNEYMNGRQHVDLLIDRPIYKPGDTVHFAVVAYTNNADGRTKKVLEGAQVQVVFKDHNWQDIDTASGISDAYGSFSGTMVISENVTPGYYHLQTTVTNGDISSRSSQSVKVEAYKQPKFMVVLTADSVRRALGQMVRIDGTAMTYSGVPLRGAKVSYGVIRSESQNWWRGRYWHMSESETQTIADGVIEVDDEGHFTILFEATGDSNLLRVNRQLYRYTVNAEVTDINGETHSGIITIPIAYRNSYLSISQEGDKGMEDLVLQHYNLDGVPVAGHVKVEVVRLQQPQRPLLPLAVAGIASEQAFMPLSEKEFTARYPLFDRDGSVSNMQRWQPGDKVWESEADVSASEPLRLSLQKLPAGAYKIVGTLLSGGDDTMSVVEYVNHIPEGSKKVVDTLLLWSRQGKEELHVGDTAFVSMGSMFDDVTVYMVEAYDWNSYRTSVHKIDNNMKTIAIPITEEMEGGLNVHLYALLHNHLEEVHYHYDVSYPDSELDIAIDTVSQTMLPGEQVLWTVRLRKGGGGLPVTGAMMMTLYDHSIDTYGSHSFGFYPWVSKDNNLSLINKGNLGVFSYHYWKHSYEWSVYHGTCSRRWNLSPATVGFYPRGVRVRSVNTMQMAKGKAMPNQKNIIVTEEAEQEEEIAYSMVESADAAQYEPEVAETGESEKTVEKEVDFRRNHSTLAFFTAGMQSDSTGTITLQFKLPDLLTEWTLKAHAWGRDMAVGHYEGRLKTQKSLMVEPTLPRYLRQGDTCQLSVKVINQSDLNDTVTVRLSLLDAKQGTDMEAIKWAAVGAGKGRNGNSASLTLAPKSSREVVFQVAVPEGGIYLCRYQLMAEGRSQHDGDEGLIPLLPSRQLVTESMSFYINGAGEKKYSMKSLVRQGGAEASKTLRHHALVVEATPNPIWMAMQALPYVQQQKNPSNIYLANSIYTNLLALKIVEDNPGLEKLFKEWRQAGGDAMRSELDRNSEVKQTVVSETPWLADADNEAARKRDMARYFEPLMLQREMNQSMKLLVESQRADGGWSWIAGDRRSSVYVTQYILKTLGELQRLGVEIDKKLSRALDKALAYVDDETYKQYVRYEKGRNISPVHLDYLYMKSLYPSAKFTKQHAAMYKFYYENAKKNNSHYRDLWSQSELALVFHRGGDNTLARDMAKRLLQKSLYSDEMGLYWRDNLSGYYWYERPIETQAMLIKTIGEVLGDRESVAKMQQWLLKQKQTTCWSSDVATVRAIEALLDGGEKRMGRVDQSSWMEVRYGTHLLLSDTTRHDIHITARLSGDEVQPGDGEVTIVKHDDGIAWGAMYWQYFERVDKVQASNMGVTMTRKLYRVNNDGTLTLLPEKDGTVTAHVGDRIKVKIHLRCDRSLEYVELTEPRAATMEPVSTASGWRWNSGLSYYISITNTKQTLYINQLDKGQYDIEYEMYVHSGGRYISAPGTVQCLYAPEFRAVCPMPTIKVER